MRILRISIEVPYPPTGGTRMEPFHTNRGLAEAGHDITLVAFQSQACDTKPVQRYCELHAFPFVARNTFPQLARGLIERFPVNYVKYRRPEVLDCCVRLLQKRSYDVILVDYGAMGWYGLRLRERIGVPLVTRWHNFDTLIWRRWCEAQRNPIQRFLGRRQAEYMARFERQLANGSDLCLAVGALDAALLQKLAPEARVRYVPHGINTDHYAPRDRSAEEAGSILFLATNYQWHPNVDAARWLCQEIMPQVWSAVPDARLYLSGRDPTPEMQRWTSERVVFTGFVPDERELLARAAVTVIPMRLGGGIKLKLLTALSMARPVVTTSQGAEGLQELTDGEHALVRDNTTEFAAAMIELLRDPARCRQLGEAGRKLVRAKCDWRVIIAEYEKAFVEVAQVRQPVSV